MSHYHLEVIIPPNTDPETVVKQVLAPFDENVDDEDKSNPFWDFYVIGGRWAGTKQEASLDKAKLGEFHAWMTETKVKVKGLQCGKQELADAATIKRVDAKWCEMFPNAGPHCLLFNHSNDQYSSKDTLPGDICRVGDCPKELTAARVIIAGPSYKNDGTYEAGYMLCASIWNGVTYQDTKWDGKIATAIEEYNRRVATYREDYAAKCRVTSDWQTITVDYHS
jgi:hypothetical protein